MKSRFRRTKDELARGVSREQAMAERDYAQAKPVPFEPGQVDRIVRNVVARSKGEILIRIRPGKGVDAEYLEHIPLGEIVVDEDNDFYKWLDHYLTKVYVDAGSNKLFADMLNQGIGGLITNIHFERDITWEPDNSSSQVS